MPGSSPAAAAVFLTAVVVVPLLISLRWLRPVERIGRALARHREVSYLTVFGFALTVSVVSTVLIRTPVAIVQDEFSYLLGADTFAHGHLTNPEHPLWKSFETFHTLVQPSYQSKYLPGQALTLAVGQKLFGLPIAGVWLTTAFAAVALLWMLAAFMPRRWAFLGALLLPLDPMLLKWDQCYWGGTLAFVGGALVCGGVRRCVDRWRFQDGLAMGVGIAVLVETRPYEGGLIALFALLALVAGATRIRWDGARLQRVIGGLAVPVLLCAALTAYYDKQVVGSALKLPYLVYHERYVPVPPLLIQPLHPLPAYDNEPMRSQVVKLNIPLYKEQTDSPSDIVICGVAKLMILWRFAFQLFDVDTYAIDPYVQIHSVVVDGLKYVLVALLVALPFALRRDGWMRWAVLGCVVGAIATLLETWINAHYVAPYGPLVALIVVGCARALWVWRPRGRAVGRALVRVVAIVYVGAFFVSWWQIRSTPLPKWRSDRLLVEQEMAASPGRKLVIVRYSADHRSNDECVYNAADIDGQKTVWARELDPQQNRALLSYYHEREAWLYMPDEKPPVLEPYPASDLANRTPVP